MTAGAGRDRDQPVGAFLDRLMGEAVVDDVVQRQAAVGVDGGVDVLARAQRRDDDRRLPLHPAHVLFDAGVGAVDDLVDREGRGGRFRMGAVVRGQRLGDFVQPFVELADRARVERGKRADDPRLALGDHQAGCEMMNSGAPIAGRRNLPCKAFGKDMAGLPICSYLNHFWRMQPMEIGCQSLRGPHALTEV